jgi:hypothetical protein
MLWLSEVLCLLAWILQIFVCYKQDALILQFYITHFLLDINNGETMNTGNNNRCYFSVNLSEFRKNTSGNF